MLASSLDGIDDSKANILSIVDVGLMTEWPLPRSANAASRQRKTNTGLSSMGSYLFKR